MVDLGSGGGIDVLLAAKKVGPNGKAIGIDMTKVRQQFSADINVFSLKLTGHAGIGASQCEKCRGH